MSSEVRRRPVRAVDASLKYDQPQEHEVVTLFDPSKVIRENKRSRYNIDVCMIVVLSVLALATRFYLLDHPREVVFDEQHFGKFLSYYLSGDYFVDIHPPLAKMLLALTGYFAGYDGSWDFPSIGTPYPDHVPYVALRSLPALFGALLVPMAYITARLIRLTPLASGLVAWLILCDTGFLIESRYILTDSTLFFFDCFVLGCSFGAANAKPLSKTWFVWLALTGVTLGCAISIKFTAMGLVGTVAVQHFLAIISHYVDLCERDSNKKGMAAPSSSSVAASSSPSAASSSAAAVAVSNSKRSRKAAAAASSNSSFQEWSTSSSMAVDVVSRVLLIAVPTIVIFYSLWVFHLSLLPYSGSGDPFHTPRFLSSLQKRDGTPANVLPPGTTEMSTNERIFGELLPMMHAINMGIDVKHPFSSTWAEWPLAQCRAVLFWQQASGDTGMWVWLTGNPVVWLTAFLVGVLGAVGLTVVVLVYVAQVSSRTRTRAKRQQLVLELISEQYIHRFLPLVVLVAGYLGNLVPYVLVPRATWNYHYLPALLFAVILVGLVVDILLKCVRRLPVASLVLKLMVAGIVVMSALVFAYLSPWVYAFPMTGPQSDTRFIFSSWRV